MESFDCRRHRYLLYPAPGPGAFQQKEARKFKCEKSQTGSQVEGESLGGDAIRAGGFTGVAVDDAAERVV